MIPSNCKFILNSSSPQIHWELICLDMLSPFPKLGFFNFLWSHLPGESEWNSSRSRCFLLPLGLCLSAASEDSGFREWETEWVINEAVVFFNPSLKLGISKKPFNWNQIPCYNSVYSKSAAGKETSSVLSFKKKRKLNWPLQFLFTPQRTWWFSDVLFQF